MRRGWGGGAQKRGGGDALEREKGRRRGEGSLAAKWKFIVEFSARASPLLVPPPAHGQLLSKQAAWYGGGGGRIRRRDMPVQSESEEAV